MTDDSTGLILMGPGSHILGSARDADLKLSHPTVSRYHARLTCTDDGVTIEDLGSTNGSNLNGSPLEGEVVITDTARLKVGRVKIDLVPIASQHHEDADPSSDLSSGASMLLGPKTVGFLRDIGQDIAFRSGEVVLRRGEQ
jgi:pSer/pThr/pTyr-binding forkhead associated (FHA) protein